MIKAIIFDMDGTVLNTLDDIMIAANHALKTKGLPEKTLDDIRKAVGNGAFKLIERIVPKSYTLEESKILFRIYQDYYDANSQVHTHPYEGIIPLLKKLKELGFMLCVVSNKFEHLVQSLNHDFFFDLFDQAIGEVKCIPIKPAPDMIYKALDLLNIQKEEALFVGDSEVDMDTATNALMKSVGVTWGFRSEELLIEHNADYIIHHPLELLDVINKENQT
jgi:phosphoglycolate phosphatase